MKRRGLLLVLSSPSGAGKTTLARRLLDSDPDISLSVSVTTRAPRPGEVDGRDYYFVDDAKFEKLRERSELIEWANVFDNFYGTPKAPVEAEISEGRDTLFDIDWQGAQQLSEKMKHDVVRVFVLPPTAEVLEQRLRERAQDAEDVVKRRMQKASDEISHWPEYDYVIINEDFDVALANLQSILSAERLKRERQEGLMGFVRNLQDAL